MVHPECPRDGKDTCVRPDRSGAADIVGTKEERTAALKALKGLSPLGQTGTELSKVVIPYWAIP